MIRVLPFRTQAFQRIDCDRDSPFGQRRSDLLAHGHKPFPCGWVDPVWKPRRFDSRQRRPRSGWRISLSFFALCRCGCGCGCGWHFLSIAWRMLDGCSKHRFVPLPPCCCGSLSASDVRRLSALCVRNFLVGSRMAPYPAAVTRYGQDKKLGQDVLDRPALLRRVGQHDPTEFVQVSRKRASVLVVMQQQAPVDAMLSQAKVGRIGQVVGRVKRYPRCARHTKTPGTGARWSVERSCRAPTGEIARELCCQFLGYLSVVRVPMTSRQGNVIPSSAERCTMPAARPVCHSGARTLPGRHGRQRHIRRPDGAASIVLWCARRSRAGRRQTTGGRAGGGSLAACRCRTRAGRRNSRCG